MLLKKITIVVLSISLILLLGMGIAYRYAEERDFFFAEIRDKLELETGYLIEKAGPVDLSLFPQPAIRFSSFSLSNPRSELGAKFFFAEQIAAQLDWRSLLSLNLVLDLEMRSTEVRLEIDQAGNPNWISAKESGDDTALAFELDRIRARDLRVRFRNHQTQEIFGLDIDHIDSDVEGAEAMVSINSAGQYDAYRFLAQGEARFRMKQGLLDLDLAIDVAPASAIQVAEIDVPDIDAWIEANRSSFSVNGTVDGSLTFSEQLPYGQLEIEAKAEKLSDIPLLRENLDFLQPGLGPLAASGALHFRGSDLDLRELAVKQQGDQLAVDVHGNVENLLARLQLDLDIKAHAASANQVITSEFLDSMPGLPLSRLESLEFSSILKSLEGGVILENTDIGFRYQSLAGKLNGDISFSDDVPAFRLELQGLAKEPGDLLSLFDLEHDLSPGLSELRLQAKINSENSVHVIEDGRLNIQNGSLTASVNGALNSSGENLGLDLRTVLEIENLDLFSAEVPEGVRPFLEGVKLRASGTVEGTPGAFKLGSMVLDLAVKDRNLSLKGDIAGLPEQAVSVADFHYTTSSPIDLSEYFPKLGDMELTGPIDLSGGVRFVNGRIAIQDINLQAAGTGIVGDINVDLDASPVRVSAEFSSQNIHAGLVVPEVDEDTDIEQESEAVTVIEPANESEAKTQKALTAEELGAEFKAYTSGIAVETDWIKQLNLYFGFKARRALIADYDVENLSIIVSARNGVLRLAEYEFVLEGRPLSMNGLIDTNPEQAVYELEGMLLGDSLEALLKLDSNLVEGGELQGTFKLSSAGNTLGGLIENLDGQATVQMGPLILRSSILNTISTGIFKTMLGGILSKQDAQATSEYQCGVLGIDVRKGVAMINKGLTLQAVDYNLAGNGSLDLNTGIIDLKVSPKARRGLGLSISTIVGGFTVKGNLATPDLGISGGGLVSAAVIGYALAPSVAAGAMTNPVTATVVATGYLAKGFIDRLTAASYTCEKTLERIQRNRARGVTSSGASAPEREF